MSDENGEAGLEVELERLRARVSELEAMAEGRREVGEDSTGSASVPADIDRHDSKPDLF